MSRRSASDLPALPAPGALRSTSWECRAALVSANRGRGARKAESERRGVAIAELQRALVELEADPADASRTRARLHALHARLGGVIRDVEDTGDALVGLIDGSERPSPSWGVAMRLRLMEQARRWPGVKAGAAALAAEAAEASSPTTQTGRAAMNAGPSIADLQEQANRERAGTDARLDRREADPLQRSGAALQPLQAGQPGGTPAPPALLGKGSFQKLMLASLSRLGREQGIKGSATLPKAALAKVLEAHGVIPSPPPLERFTNQERIALVRRLLAGPEVA